MNKLRRRQRAKAKSAYDRHNHYMRARAVALLNPPERGGLKETRVAANYMFRGYNLKWVFDKKEPALKAMTALLFDKKEPETT